MADYKPGYEYECAYCGKDNELSYYRDDEPQYCDNTCAHKARSEESRFDVECSFCGQQTTVDKYAYERNEHYFCDRQCWQENQKTRVKVHCEVCDEEEWVTPTRAKSYRTCSKECLGELQEETMSGSSNPNYNSDVSDETVKELYEDGKSLPEIKNKTELSLPALSDRLHRMGVEVRPAGYPKEVKTSFGLMVRSRYERDVAEALRDKGIDFEYEPSFPGPYIPDFVLSDETVIEVWGVVGDEYQERRKLKEDWYRTNGYNIIGIEPDDIPNQVMKVVMENKQ